MRRHLALHEDRRAGRIDPEREVLGRGDQGASTEHRGVLRHGDRMQVHHTEEWVVLVLKTDPLADRAQCVAQM